MELSHRFSVPIPVDEAWAHFNDIATVAECFPGATVSSAEGDTFSGSVKVKLGPIALLYNGSGTFVDKDEAAHRFVVDAKGKDKRGNGTAGAKVTLTMTGVDGGTDVEVLTDLSVTGKPAQFGRGVMQDVSDKLLGQFVACLEQRFADQTPAAEPAAAPAGEDAAEAADDVDQDAGPASAPTGAAAEPPPTGDQDAGAASAPSSRPQAPSRPPRPSDDAIDLGATVLPVLLRTYWKHALAGLAVVAVVVWILVRR